MRKDDTNVARSRGLNIALWTLQILLGAAFAFAGVNKLFALQPEVVVQFDRIGLGDWFRYLTGLLELAGAIGLVIPRLSGLAALGLVGVMIGAVLTHLLVLPPVALALVPAVIALLFALVAWGRWPQTKAMLAR